MFEEKVQRKFIWQQVLEDIRRRIILGEINKDEHLKEAELSDELGVSRGPIREAIAQLEKEGLVHTSKNGRTKVVGFSIKDVEDLYFSRITIETAAIEQMNFPLDQTWLKDIAVLVKAMDEENESKDYLNQLDLKFHHSLTKLSNNKTLIQMWLSISGLIKTIMEITNERTSTKRDHVLHHHQDILDALHLGDKAKLKQALEEHLLYAKDVLKTLFETIHK